MKFTRGLKLSQGRRNVSPNWFFFTLFLFIILLSWCGATGTRCLQLTYEAHNKHDIASRQYTNVLIKLNQRAIYLLMEIEKSRLAPLEKGVRI